MTAADVRVWQPLRTAEDWRPAHEACLAAIKAGADAVGELLARPVDGIDPRDLTLARGLVGWAALDRAVRAADLGARPFLKQAVGAGVLVRALETGRHFDASLFTGQTGFLWGMAAATPECLPAVTRAAAGLAASLRDAGPDAMHFDLVLGTTGLLTLGRLVAESTGDRRLVDAALGRLTATAESTSVWRTPVGRYRVVPPDVAGDFYHDWGVAHGIPGVVAVAALCEVRLGQSARARRYLADFELAGELIALADGMRDDRQPLLPSFSGPGGLQFTGQASWCYGDAGACTALALAALAAELPDRARPLLEPAERALRRGLNHLPAMEPGLCHGAAGLALLASRLHGATREQRFADLAVDIVDRALGLGKFDIAAVVAEYGTGLLRGSTGVGLALHAVLSDAAPNWDVVLGLS
jgi:hypothetical protein